MAHTFESRQKAYNKVVSRRQEWFYVNGPCVICGSWDKLELDHINPSDKISHKIWSWRSDKREAELLKCQVLCQKCHINKSAEEKRRDPIHGSASAYRRGCRCDTCRNYQIKRMEIYHLNNPR